MNCTAELARLVTEHPDLPIIPYVDSEVVADDGYAYWAGAPTHASLERYTFGYYFDLCGDNRTRRNEPMIELLRSYEVSAPDDGEEVIVVCKDDSCYVATYYDVDQWNEKPRWFVDGPMGCARRLQKKVLWWMPRPHLPDEEDMNA